MIKKLLSLPPNLVGSFHNLTGLSEEEYSCGCDPVDHKLGSGGGTAWLLKQFPEKGRKIILHAGGQSRRLPAYAPSGKILTPIPIFRWERGQRLSQDLLSIQLPLYESIMNLAPEHLKTCIVSGDVYIRTSQPLQPVPDADVVCYGLWLPVSIAKDHGVFVSSRKDPSRLKCMLQKPTPEQLAQLSEEHFYLTDIGIWLFSDRALKLLMKKATGEDGQIREYDMYTDFGGALGTEPSMPDEEVGSLSVAIVPLAGGEFYHFGTSHELLSSTVEVQNLVNDQREIIHHDLKPHPSIFVQNAITKVKFTPENQNVWVENSFVASGWTITKENIITGVPENNWQIALQPGECLDIVPIGDKEWAIRPYLYNARFDGARQTDKLFPVVSDINTAENVVKEMFANMRPDGSPEPPKGDFTLLSAQDISNKANLERLFAQRKAFRAENWPQLAANYRHSVFYQIDLDDAAKEFADENIPLPAPLPDDAPLLTRIHDAMFRSQTLRLKAEAEASKISAQTGDTSKIATNESGAESSKAFSLLREGLTATVLAEKQQPQCNVYSDQIVWGRSPVRIDLSGGWTDTPPYCLIEGGSVVNVAIELNGQQPIQTYIRPCKEKHIVLRSIDLGAREEITEYEGLAQFNKVGSPFSIPKAALVLAGFQPGFSQTRYNNLEQQLDDFGCGFEITLLSAIPAGSGLGTSSVLAATVLGTVNDFCGLGWDSNKICKRTLVLEQMLTTGGGWQDQFGGVLPGLKLLQTQKGFEQSPVVRWLPSDLYTRPDYKACHLLYYTGITRTAKTILAEIVRGMFLNKSKQMHLLRSMKEHAHDMFETVQRADFTAFGKLVGKTWLQNQAIDSGTNPPAVEAITRLVDDYCLGYKLPGAGGGGYLYMVAKDPEAAAKVRQILNASTPNKNARFVDMTISPTGLQISRS